MIHQLRIYEIFEHNKAAFHARFRDHAMRIMRKYGFELVDMWETSQRGRTEFVYLLRWPDREAMHSAWQQFRADEDWTRIKKETVAASGELLGNQEDRVLARTEYSPALER